MDIAKPPRRGVLIAVEGIATWIVSAILEVARDRVTGRPAHVGARP